ncbi:MAG TPA: lysylphosphatidylglycerol synthase transmembrane domain-containing protein [Chthoniobacterales bacterium]|nr:lysylphosphatidylglycerol synthase transmembrane domain-containing protein [Chthoniobacterales bacterium]
MKRILLTILQLSVTVAMLWWVFHDPTQRAKMWEALQKANYWWVGGAVLAYVTVEVSAAIRWQILLRVQKINLTMPRVGALFLIGMFYNQFLPGGTGGDIIKSYLLLKETEKKAGGLLAVVFDRLIGLVALVAITVALVSLRFDWLWNTPVTVEAGGVTPRRLLLLLLFLLGTSLAGLFASFIISGFNLFRWLPPKFPGREKLMEISAAYHLYAHHWIATSAAFVVSLVAHLATFATFLCVAYAFGAAVSVLDFFAVLPIERTITALPISFAGVGLREQILQVLLSNLCHIDVPIAKLIGTMSFLVILFCSAPGGIVYFFYRPSGATKHVRMRDMKREVETLEHELSETE